MSSLIWAIRKGIKCSLSCRLYHRSTIMQSTDDNPLHHSFRTGKIDLDAVLEAIYSNNVTLCADLLLGIGIGRICAPASSFSYLHASDQVRLALLQFFIFYCGWASRKETYRDTDYQPRKKLDPNRANRGHLDLLNYNASRGSDCEQTPPVLPGDTSAYTVGVFTVIQPDNKLIQVCCCLSFSFSYNSYRGQGLLLLCCCSKDNQHFQECCLLDNLHACNIFFLVSRDLILCLTSFQRYNAWYYEHLPSASCYSYRL